MSSAKKILLCAAATTLLGLLAACGSGNGTAVPANVRLVNISSKSLTMSLSGVYSVPAVAPDSVSSYSAVPPGTYTASVAATDGSISSPAQTLSLGTGQNYTTLAFQRGNVVYASTMTDNISSLTGYFALNVANISPDAGALDIYVLPATSCGSSLAGLAPTFSSVQGLSNASTFATTNAANAYSICVTAAGNQSDVRLQIPNLPITGFASAQAYTLALTSTTGGALVNGALVQQGGAVQTFAATQARVRVLSALPVSNNATPAVSVTVAGTASSPSNVVLPNEYSPNPIPYSLVPGGSVTSAMTITVNGAPVTFTLPGTAPATFAAGSDYTVLVYGTTASPSVTLLTDNNQISSNTANVRLINAADTISGGPTLQVNGALAASNVAYGTASAYAGVTPSSQASLNLLSGDYNALVYPYQLVSGKVYTVFVYSTAASGTSGQDTPPAIFEDR
jgi:hypothetical protein